MAKILEIVPRDDYTLWIEIDNHNHIILDMKPRLQSIRFGALADLTKFKAVSILNKNTIVWDEQCQITIDEIMSITERFG